MQWLKQLLARPPAPVAPTVVGGFPAPWGLDRPSLHGHLADFALEADGALPAAASTLPDEELVRSRSGSSLAWAPGALDGVMGHHVGESPERSIQPLLRALIAASTTRSPEAVKDLYDMANDAGFLQLVDPLMEALLQRRDLDPAELHALARWLAREAPDRAPVKLGIALLGMLRPAQDTDLLLRLGRHEEFTLFAGVALSNSLPEPEANAQLWALARAVKGWGRIQLVERLARAPGPELRAWLLREGFRNEVMNEYLAHTCATAGGLLDALQAPVIDDALFLGAGDLLRALFTEGPSADITQYDDGAAVVDRFLTHARGRTAAPLDTCLALSDIAGFVEDEDRDWAALEALGWTATRRAGIARDARQLLADPVWERRAVDGMASADTEVFWTASTVAETLGLDTWERRFDRQDRGLDSQWYHLMRTEDAARVERVVALAERQFDLAAIATGPGEELGWGPAFRQHSNLDMIVQSLGRFPGRGWTLVAASLRSPVVRNRHVAVRVLKAWDRTSWPAEAGPLIERAVREECNADVREALLKLRDP